MDALELVGVLAAGVEEDGGGVSVERGPVAAAGVAEEADADVAAFAEGAALAAGDEAAGPLGALVVLGSLDARA